MKKFLALFFVGIISISISSTVFAAVTSAPGETTTTPQTRDKQVTSCSATCRGDAVCVRNCNKNPNLGGKADTTANTDGGAASGGYVPDTQTRIPDPLGGGLCDDLLACNKQSLGSFVGDLKSGIQETYVYREMIPQIIKIVLNIAGGLAVLMLVYSGMLFLTAGGDEEQSSKAIKTITFTLIGIAVITLSRVIVAIVENLPLG